MTKITIKETALYNFEEKVAKSGKTYATFSILAKTDSKNQAGQWETLDKFYINGLVFDEEIINQIKTYTKTDTLVLFDVDGNLKSEIFNGERKFSLFVDKVSFNRELTPKNNSVGSPTLSPTETKIEDPYTTTDDNPFK